MLHGIVLYHGHSGLDQGQQWQYILFHILVSHTRTVDAARVSSRDVVYQRGKTQLAIREHFSLPGASYSLLWALGWHKRNLISQRRWEFFSHSLTIYEDEKILRNYQEFGWLLDTVIPKGFPLINTNVTTQHNIAWSQSRDKKCHYPVSSAFLWAEGKF